MTVFVNFVKTLRMEKSTHQAGDRLRMQGERLRQAQTGMPHKKSGDRIDRLSGEMTPLSFVVELGAKGWRERCRS